MRRILVSTIGLFVTMSLSVNGQQPGRSATSPGSRTAAASRALDARSLPGTRSGVFTTIQGNALNPTNGPLLDAAVRLRDARSGRIVDSQITDKSGMFVFRGVEPGSYIVEIVGDDQTILAASQMLGVNAGDALSAVVKLPFRIPLFAGILGHSAQSAAVVAAVAGSAEVLAIKATACVSPPCPN